MSRLVNRLVPVTAHADGTPASFRFRGAHRVRRILECWRESGEWWEGRGARRLYRVETEDDGVFELLFELDSGRWTLTRNYD